MVPAVKYNQAEQEKPAQVYRTGLLTLHEKADSKGPEDKKKHTPSYQCVLQSRALWDYSFLSDYPHSHWKRSCLLALFKKSWKYFKGFTLTSFWCHSKTWDESTFGDE